MKAKELTDMAAELTEDQVNLICAAFEGYKVECIDWQGQMMLKNKKFRHTIAKKPYTQDLNSLVPIWEKLNLHHFTLDGKIDRPVKVLYFDHEFRGKGETVQQAAAHTTALAILEIKPELRELL